MGNSFKFQSKIHGKNVKISQPDCLIAYRESISLLKPTSNAYVFLDKPVEFGRSYFCIQIVGIDQNKIESTMSLGIGCRSMLISFNLTNALLFILVCIKFNQVQPASPKVLSMEPQICLMMLSFYWIDRNTGLSIKTFTTTKTSSCVWPMSFVLS